jgi:hypothetical protein
MIEFGLVIFLGLVAIAIKLPWNILLRLLAYPITVDLTLTGLVYIMHFGTLGGTMGATMAGVMCSIATTGARWLWGYIEGGVYYPGKFTIPTEKLIK